MISNPRFQKTIKMTSDIFFGGGEGLKVTMKTQQQQNFAGVDVRLSEGSNVLRLGSKDPHWRQRLFQILLKESEITDKLVFISEHVWSGQ